MCLQDAKQLPNGPEEVILIAGASGCSDVAIQRAVWSIWHGLSEVITEQGSTHKIAASVASCLLP